MKAEALLRNIEAVAVHGSAPGDDILGVACDSRQARAGFVFVAIHGRREDGWEYMADAVARGASIVVSQHPAAHVGMEGAARAGGGPVCFVQVPDARLALARLSDAFFDHPSGKLDMVGITGTNGKTTTAYLARAILAADGRRPGMLTTVQYEMGERTIPALRTTPEAPALQNMLNQMVHAGCRSAVMEVSSHALDQHRVTGVDYDVAVFTNLTRDHLDYHVTMEAYFEAKKRLFDALGRREKGAVGVVNMDDEWGRRLIGSGGFAARIYTFGAHPSADIRAEAISVTGNGTRFRVVSPWGATDVDSRLLGRFNLSNSLAAMSVAGCLGIDLDRAAKALSETGRVSGRLEEIPNARGIKVFVDYAHTDDALKNVLGTLRELVKGRLIVVFGCGGNRDPSKRPIMGRVAETLADYSILTSDNPRGEDPREIIREIERGVEKSAAYEVQEDRKGAIERAVSLARPGDVVLIAGKGHEKFQEFANTTVGFADGHVAREALGAGGDPA